MFGCPDPACQLVEGSKISLILNTWEKKVFSPQLIYVVMYELQFKVALCDTKITFVNMKREKM